VIQKIRVGTLAIGPWKFIDSLCVLGGASCHCSVGIARSELRLSALLLVPQKVGPPLGQKCRETNRLMLEPNSFQ